MASKTAEQMGLVKMMTAKYAGACACCGGKIRAGKDTIGYSREAKAAFCRGCSAIFFDKAEKVAAIIAAKKTAPAKAAARQTSGFRPVSGCGRCRILGRMCPDCRHDEYDL